MTATLPESVTVPGPLVTTNEFIYILGGWSSGTAPDEVLRYSPETDVLERMSYRIPNARFGFGAFYDGSYAYLVGGAHVDAAGRYQYLDEVVRLDLDTGQASQMSPLPSGLVGGEAIWNGEAGYVFGGTAEPTCPVCANSPNTHVLKIDPGENRVGELDAEFRCGGACRPVQADATRILLVTEPEYVGAPDMSGSEFRAPARIREFTLATGEERELWAFDSAYRGASGLAVLGDDIYFLGGKSNGTVAACCVPLDLIFRYSIPENLTSVAYPVLPVAGSRPAVGFGDDAYVIGRMQPGCDGCPEPAHVLKYDPTTLHAPPDVDAVWWPTNPRRTEPVQFEDRTVKEHGGRITGHLWDFGDGTNSTELNPRHTFAGRSEATVRLSVRDAEGQTDSAEFQITFRNHEPVADFSLSTNDTSVGRGVDFAALSSDPDGTVEGYQWAFGDGTGASTTDARHVFQAEGRYDVQLTVTDNDGAHASRRQTVRVSPGVFAADFTFEPDQPREGQYVAFTDTSFHPHRDIKRWRWDFGDGTNSTLQNPSHAFPYPGTFRVNLTATASGGPVAFAEHQVEVSPSRISFTYEPRNPILGAAVRFADTSPEPDGVVGRAWSFGDGTGNTEAAPEHAFPSAGDFQVELALARADGSEQRFVRVIHVGLGEPAASFGLTPPAPTTADSVRFLDASTGGELVRWVWDFGDGATGEGRDPLHRFERPGPYTITMRVWNSAGASASSTQRIEIGAGRTLPPEPRFSWDQDSIDRRVIRFLEASTDPDGRVVVYEWDFGDGATSTLRAPLSAVESRPRHTYAAPGPYHVFLTVRDDGGAVGTVDGTVHVDGARPVANFTFSPRALREREVIEFDDRSLDPDGMVFRREWDFGDGSGSSLARPTHRYESAGAFVVTLRVFDEEGFGAEISTAILVTPRAVGGPDGGGDARRDIPGFEVFLVGLTLWISASRGRRGSGA